MFIEIEDKLINLDNVIKFSMTSEPCNNIVIRTNDGFPTIIEFKNEEEMMKTWEWLRHILPR